jgi:hypothetical protein
MNRSTTAVRTTRPLSQIKPPVCFSCLGYVSMSAFPQAQAQATDFQIFNFFNVSKFQMRASGKPCFYFSCFFILFSLPASTKSTVSESSTYLNKRYPLLFQLLFTHCILYSFFTFCMWCYWNTTVYMYFSISFTCGLHCYLQKLTTFQVLGLLLSIYVCFSRWSTFET